MRNSRGDRFQIYEGDRLNPQKTPVLIPSFARGIVILGKEVLEGITMIWDQENEDAIFFHNRDGILYFILEDEEKRLVVMKGVFFGQETSYVYAKSTEEAVAMCKGAYEQQQATRGSDPLPTGFWADMMEIFVGEE